MQATEFPEDDRASNELWGIGQLETHARLLACEAGPAEPAPYGDIVDRLKSNRATLEVAYHAIAEALRMGRAITPAAEWFIDNFGMKNWKTIQFLNKNLMIGVGLFCLSSVFYVGAMKYGELSLLYPITSLSYIWISLLSVKFLGERMNRYKWLGILLIIIGVALINHPS